MLAGFFPPSFLVFHSFCGFEFHKYVKSSRLVRIHCVINLCRSTDEGQKAFEKKIFSPILTYVMIDFTNILGIARHTAVGELMAG